MQVKEVMSSKPEVLPQQSSIREAAMLMRDCGAGFIPVYEEDKLVGTVTDRDLVTRALAEGVSLDDNLSTILGNKVLYCFEEDDLNSVLENLRDNEVQRLVVLDNPESKNLVGLISLSDIADCCGKGVSAEAIAECCRHYH